jgi:hypothetical protein
VNPHAQHVVFHDYTKPGVRGVFDGPHTMIETDDGDLIDGRTDPAASLAEQTTTTAWDDLDVVYTAGFDLWGFFTAPFSLATPTVPTQEIEPWEEAGERWRRLKAVFPKGHVAHAAE